ncbi:MAG: hypothetical protein JWP59_3864 [Massilia sp.]|nr:hypothetical protein [Massilia sp.]
MRIVYCRRCASELPDTAPTCSKCGAPQARVAAAAGLMAPDPSDLASARTVGAIGRRLLALILIGIFITVAMLAYPVLVGLGWAS